MPGRDLTLFNQFPSNRCPYPLLSEENTKVIYRREADSLAETQIGTSGATHNASHWILNDRLSIGIPGEDTFAAIHANPAFGTFILVNRRMPIYLASFNTCKPRHFVAIAFVAIMTLSFP
jgi:hypothetical protein